MDKLFGTNGVRGVFSEDFTLEFVHDLVLAISTYFKEGRILVGYDGRDSSVVVSKLVCSTLNYAGLDCHLAGLIPTPCLEFATKALGYNGGIMITASHNPPEYNGIKPVASDGVEVSREDEKVIEDIFFKKNWKHNSSTWGSTKNDDRAVQTYLDGIKSQVDVSKIKSRKLKVVLDLGNGAQSVTAIKLCEQLECEIITINREIDGSFSGRGPEPTPYNLQELSSAVVKNNANLGIAFDGDGDRSIFCDNKGMLLSGDKSALLLSNYLLKKNPNSKVVTCMNSGNSIDEIVTQTNSTVIRTKVGSIEVSRKMITENALLGFEENGGFMFGKHNHVRDGGMTLALLLELLASSNKSMSEELATLPPSFTTKDKISCKKEDADKIISKLLAEFPSADTTDGIKIIFDKKNWVMVRPSGTEPIIRIYAESDSEKNLETLMKEYTQKIKSFLDR
ncbi:phosphoglucosamine mutase [Marine Group I thaumarchaeote]|uniref:Phosphoglucosamine mutase n=1 Tax=Marine Group I thaumarchaeote TaxID=2511932 RepID=A0A7K4MYZ6_9ARCH|nr:phosphoglucosamine mutase [Marine Group I thaumarchaeote]